MHLSRLALLGAVCCAACPDKSAADRRAAAALHLRNVDAALASRDFERARIAARFAAKVDPLDARAHDAEPRVRLSELAEAPEQSHPDPELDYDAAFLLERDPANAALYLSAQAWLAIARGDSAAAEAAAQKAVAARPGYGPAHLALGQVYFGARRADDAAAELSKALEQNPKSFAALIRLGRVELLRGHNDRAVELLQRAVEARDDANARMSLGVAHWNLHHVKEAGDELQRAANMDASSPEGHLELANYLLLTNRDAEAQREFETAGRLGGGAAASFGQGLLAMRRKDYPAAIKLFEMAAEGPPRMPQALYQGALAHESQGDTARAAELYRDYLGASAALPEEKQRREDATLRLQRLAK